MNWRRFLWLSLSALLAWGLYLSMPEKPRWVLPENEVPLKVNATHMVTMRVDPSKEDLLASVQQAAGARFISSEVDGPLHVRDLKTGQVVWNTPGPADKVSYLWKMSPDLRFAFFINEGARTVEAHDLGTGARWAASSNHRPPDLSPCARIVIVYHQSHLPRLLDARTGQAVVDTPPGYDLQQIAPDDSWILLVGPSKDNEDPSRAWMLWQRRDGAIKKGVFPGAIQTLCIAPDGHTAAIRFHDAPQLADQLMFWDMLRGEVLRVVNAAPRENSTFVFSPDSKRLAVWSDTWVGKPLELFELASGKRTCIANDAMLLACRFSWDGTQIAAFEGDLESKSIVVRSVPDLEMCWRRSAGVGFLPDLDWLDTKGNLLLASEFAPFPKIPFLLDGVTGRELRRRPSSDVSVDKLGLIHIESSQNHLERSTPEKLLRWLPWFKNMEFVHVTVQEAETGREVFHRRVAHPADQMPPWMHWAYCDRTTLVLMSSGRDTEIWDLPPARRWGWILGPPTVMIALPWLGQIRRRRIKPIPSPLPSTAS